MHLVRATTIMCAIALAAAAAGCGDDDVDDSGDVTFADSGTPDANRPPDAAGCDMTQCGDECVDTETDTAHCGGCDMACDSPGQICSGSLPCACPEPFLPDTIEPSGLDQVQDANGLTLAIAPLLGAPINVFLVGYTEDTPTTRIDLADGVPPLVAAGYDVDPEAGTARTGYQAIAGRLRITEHCSVGARGTLRNAEFVEIDQETAMPVEGGCTFTVPLLTFDIGDPCP
jgi:hypothetical protein